jgi:hypothetical protein
MSVSRNCVKSYIFWKITLCGQLKVNRRFGGTCCFLVICFMLVSCLAYSSTPKMEENCSSKTSVEFQWAVWRHIQNTLHKKRSGNLKSYRHIRSSVLSETPTYLIRKIFKSEQVILQRCFKDNGYIVSKQMTMYDK